MLLLLLAGSRGPCCIGLINVLVLISWLFCSSCQLSFTLCYFRVQTFPFFLFIRNFSFPKFIFPSIPFYSHHFSHTAHCQRVATFPWFPSISNFPVLREHNSDLFFQHFLRTQIYSFVLFQNFPFFKYIHLSIPFSNVSCPSFLHQLYSYLDPFFKTFLTYANFLFRSIHSKNFHSIK